MRRFTRVMLVLDSTCLIHFAQLELIDRLAAAGAIIGITEAVRQEVGLEIEGKRIKGLTNSALVQKRGAESVVLDESLGEGERQSIAVCRDDLKWRIFVSDDHHAQRVAESLGVQTLDTRGLLWNLCVARRISYAEFCDGVRRVRGRGATFQSK